MSVEDNAGIDAVLGVDGATAAAQFGERAAEIQGVPERDRGGNESERCLPISPQSVGSTSISPAIICGILTALLISTVSGHFASHQQTFPRPLLPKLVPDPVLLTVLSCPFYGVTPSNGCLGPGFFSWPE